jgi:hypothetical protein
MFLAEACYFIPAVRNRNLSACINFILETPHPFILTQKVSRALPGYEPSSLRHLT